MPGLWWNMPLGLAALLQGAVQTERFDEGLVVEWRRKAVQIEREATLGPSGETIWRESTIVTFADGVTARFGVTRVASEALELRLDEDDPRGVAYGSVRIEDPEATAEAMRAEFHWRTQRGFAEGVTVHIGDIFVRAGRLEVEPGRWKVYDADIVPCSTHSDVLRLHASEVRIEPGERAFGKKLSFEILGKRFITLSRHETSLRPESKGIRTPSLSLRSGFRPGLTWANDFRFGADTLVTASFSSFPDRANAGSLYVTRRLSGGAFRPVLAEPRSDLDDPTGTSYFENVTVASPEAERKYIASQRASLSVGASASERVVVGTERAQASKPWEFVAEAGGEVGRFAGLLQVRWHRIGNSEQGYANRATMGISLLSPTIPLARSLFAIARLDARTYANPHAGHTWGRLQSGLVYESNDTLRLSLAYAAGAESGPRRFEFDTIAPLRGLSVRADFGLGQWRLGWLSRWDSHTREWFDHQLSLRLATGCLEPFVAYRSATQSLSFGVELRSLDRLNAATEALVRRDKHNRPLEATPRNGT